MCRDTATAKAITALFEQLKDQHKGKISLTFQSSSMMPEHLLPMIQVLKKGSNQLIMQIFNFVDYCGGAQKIDLPALKAFLQSKGIIDGEALTGKDQETYFIANMSSHLNEQALDDSAVEKLNAQMAEIDDMKQVESMKLMEEAAAARNDAMVGISQGLP